MILRPHVVTSSRRGTRTSLFSHVNRESGGGPQRRDPPRPSTLGGTASPTGPTISNGEGSHSNSDLLLLSRSFRYPTVASRPLTITVGLPVHAKPTDVGTMGIMIPVATGFTSGYSFGLPPLGHPDSILNLLDRGVRGPLHVRPALILAINLNTALLVCPLMRVTGTFVCRRISGPILGTPPVSGVSPSTLLKYHSLVLLLGVLCYCSCLTYY